MRVQDGSSLPSAQPQPATSPIQQCFISLRTLWLLFIVALAIVMLVIPPSIAPAPIGGYLPGQSGLFAGSFFTGLLLLWVVCIVGACIDARVFVPTFRACGRGCRNCLTSSSSDDDDAAEEVFDRDAALKKNSCLARVAALGLWSARAVTALLFAITVVGNSSRRSSAIAPTSELPVHESLGRVASGPFFMYLMCWLVAGVVALVALVVRCVGLTCASASAFTASPKMLSMSRRGKVEGAAMPPFPSPPPASLLATSNSPPVVAALELESAPPSNGTAMHATNGNDGDGSKPGSKLAKKALLARKVNGWPFVSFLYRAAAWACPGRCCSVVPLPCEAHFCTSAMQKCHPPPACGALMIATTLALSLWGLTLSHSLPELVETTVPLARLPAGLSGFRIGALTDTHVGTVTGAARLSAAIDTLLAARPHIVAIVGDMTDQDESVYAPAWAPLFRVAQACNASSPLAKSAAAAMRLGGANASDVCLGAFYVSGNHEGDYGTVQGKVDILLSWGVRVLTNERLRIPFGGVSGDGGMDFDLAGVPDFATSIKQPYATPTSPDAMRSAQNVSAAMEGRDPSRELVLLAHQPRHATAAAAAGVGLMIAGHVHGGQFVPVTFVAAAFNNGLLAVLYKYTRDSTDASNPQPLWVYVSAGTYEFSPSFRHVKREVTLLTLVKAP